MGCNCISLYCSNLSGSFRKNCRYLWEKKDLSLWNSAFQPCIPCNDSCPLNRDADGIRVIQGIGSAMIFGTRVAIVTLCLSTWLTGESSWHLHYRSLYWTFNRPFPWRRDDKPSWLAKHFLRKRTYWHRNNSFNHMETQR